MHAQRSSRIATRFAPFALVCIFAFIAPGCKWSHTRGHWHEPQTPPLAAVRELPARERQVACNCGAELLVAAAGSDVAEPSTAGLYYQAALGSGRCLETPGIDEGARSIAWHTYQASLKGLLVALSQQSQATAGSPFIVIVGGQAVQLSVSLHGFAWQAQDLQQFAVVEDYDVDSISRVHRRSGIGIPIVIERRQRTGSAAEQFLPPRSDFGATAVLRPTADDAGHKTTATATLELYNPHTTAAIDVGDRQMPLAADFSAALAYYAIHESPSVNPISSFLDPGASSGNEGLYFWQPYQRGKIPIVFVHGLVSSPSTWTDMINDLRATPGFDERYQVWAFRYATGNSFLRAAAHLRRSLYEAAATVDPNGEDPALNSMVLVGHSMGGLVSKLQVVDSRNELWRTVASRSFEQIVANDRTRRELAAALFFEPQPNVRRVVFIAVPHGGSSWATRPVGRVASTLVRGDEERDAMHQQLIADNPGVFSPAVERRLPTSIDMLEPKNPLLLTIRGLPVTPEVTVHSIIGTGGMLSAIEPSDGIVPVASALHPNAASTTYIAAKHERVHRQAETVRQMQAILAQHLEECAVGAEAKRIELNRRPQ